MKATAADDSSTKPEATINTPTVWMIIPSFYPATGGAEIQVKQLAKAYIAQGWSVQVLTRRHSHASAGDQPTWDMVEGIPTIRVRIFGGRLATIAYMATAFCQLMLHGRGAIYHAHDIGAEGWLAVIAAHLLGGRSIIKLRTGRWGFEQRLSSRLSRWQFQRLLRMADRVVPVNNEVGEMVKGLGIPEHRVSKIPNGVDTNYFCPIPAQEKIAIRWKLGLPTDQILFLYVGRLVQIKGVDILLRGWALLPEDIRSCSLLLIVGDGSEREALEDIIRSLGLQECVQFTGNQQVVRDYYGAADIFVLPSRSEGLSGSLLEAMACGLPVVVSDVGGALDVVDDAHGAKFKSGDHHELAQTLLAMHDKKDRWAEMGASARQRVQAYAALDSITNRLLDLYRRLAKRQPEWASEKSARED